MEAVQNKLRGESGTSVNVSWLDSENAQHTADLTHSGFTANSVDPALVQGNVGYIKIWQFDNSTPSELDFALRSLTASGAQSFIFDLRDNGGGILDDAISCIKLVAPEGVLAYAEDKAGNRTLLGSSTGDSVISQPTVCLVNENTASAAELFASSLRTPVRHPASWAAPRWAKGTDPRAAPSASRTAVPSWSRWQSSSAATAPASTAPA